MAPQTFIAGLTSDQLIAPWVIDGAINQAAFDTYVETQLAPRLRPGTIIISGHKAKPGQFKTKGP